MKGVCKIESETATKGVLSIDRETGVQLVSKIESDHPYAKGV